jgi:hypothetical protein
MLICLYKTKEVMSMAMNTEWMRHSRQDNRICVNVEGYKIYYTLEDKNNYTYGAGAGTMREYLENIENEEASTHYLKLEGSDWKTIIHGLVPFKFFKTTNEEGTESSLVMSFHFTGAGTSPTRIEPGIVNVELGKLFVSDAELKLVTDDGKEHVYTKN